MNCSTLLIEHYRIVGPRAIRKRLTWHVDHLRVGLVHALVIYALPLVHRRLQIGEVIDAIGSRLRQVHLRRLCLNLHQSRRICVNLS